MLKFLTSALVILLLTAPGFFSTEIYVVDKIIGTEMTLEPLSDPSREIQITNKKTFPEIAEGEVVTIRLAGDYIINITPQPTLKAKRETHIGKLLTELGANLDYCD